MYFHGETPDDRAPALYLTSPPGSFFYSTLIGICATNATSSTFPAIFYAPLAFEVFVFALTAFRAVQDAKILTGSGSAPFLLVLYRGMLPSVTYINRLVTDRNIDGLISFIVMLTMRLWNIWIVRPRHNWFLSIVLTLRIQYVTGPVSSFNLGTMCAYASQTIRRCNLISPPFFPFFFGRLMWSISTVLTTRVYMNLVWLANRPLLDPTSWHTDIPLSTSLAIGTGTHIRMHVTTFTEIHVDRRDPKRPSALAGLGLDNGIREEEQGSI